MTALLSKTILRHVVAMSFVPLLGIGTAFAQEPVKNTTEHATRTVHVVDREAVISGTLQLLRARGIGQPLIVIDGRVVSPPLPQYVRRFDIECIEVRPGRSATLEFRRGFQDRFADGVLMIWTRGSIARRPANCSVPS